MSDPQTDSQKNYKKTLNLPKTSFPMKANLVQNEPASLKRWDKANLYEQVRTARRDAPPFVFHDGPPYANGAIHLGHLLNKVLKDFVVRSRTMMGMNTPYIPGWDCHGLPIEHKVVQDLGERARTMQPMQIRKRCKDYAEKFVKLQKQQMQRLLTLADYDNPYLTMHPAYEAAVLEVFADMVARKIVYRGLKPVHWSIENQTALAEAELEYEDRQDTSVYVLFELHHASKLPAALRTAAGDLPVQLAIWTTTPWTLPANLAVAVHARFTYGLYRLQHHGRESVVILATDLVSKVFKLAGHDAPQPVATCTGSELVGLTYQHPFLNDERTRPVVAADYVTLEDGTGLVHTAPGHGTEDYQTGLREGLEIYCPVQADGTFDATAPDWLQGKLVWDANDLVVDHLRNSGHLLHDHKFTHSYPHDWRGKTPTIFRATEQWFVGVDEPFRLADAAQPPASTAANLRDRAQAAIKDVHFIPDWGRNRLRGMLESRPDWCISRQRSWGLPIPAFYPPEGVEGDPLCTPASVRAVAQVVREHGSDAWFTMEPADLLKHYDAAGDADAPDWIKSEIRNSKFEITKGRDIFDVWFESGSSWFAVMVQRGLAHDTAQQPATDLYLEGSDQHRGWFQSSLLPAVAVTGRSPFATVLTHGFMVDKNGRKMSKSIGNTLDVEELLKSYGADVCRWWVSSLNTDNDIKVDESFFQLAGEEYRKVRNTIRFLLSNLSDFNPANDAHEFTDADATSIDAWALGELDRLIEQVRTGYERYQFRRVSETLFNFCNDTLSAVYLTAVKDRLYCDRVNAPRRRRTQTALFAIVEALCRLLAPLLPHTADETWQALLGDTAQSVHLVELPRPTGVKVDAEWAKIIRQRENWLRVIEKARQSTGIDSPLDCGLVIAASEKDLANFDLTDLADLCGVSRLSVQWSGDTHVLDLRDEPRCERSWKRDGTVKQRSDGGHLTDRDAEAVGV